MTQLNPFTGKALPTGWTASTADEIKAPDADACVAGPFGSSISSKFFRPAGVPVVRGSNLSLKLERFVAYDFVFIEEELANKFWKQNVVADDLVFTCWGSIGQVGIIPHDGPFERYVISNKQLKLRIDREKLLPLFAYYYFASPTVRAYIQSLAKGAAVPGISLGILKSIPVIIPPLPIQKRIAAILSAYDDLIEVNTRRITILEEMARRTYEEWFGRPGNGINKISDVAFDAGQKIKPALAQQFDRYVPIDCLPRRSVTLLDERPIAEAQSSLQAFSKDDVLFGAMRAYFHKVVIAPFSGLTRSTCLVVRASSPCWRSYVLLTLSSEQAIDHATAHSTGSTIPYTKWAGAVSDFRLDLPSESRVSEFEDSVGPMIDLLQKFFFIQRNLRAQRDLLLPRLVSGKLDISALDAAEGELADA